MDKPISNLPAQSLPEVPVLTQAELERIQYLFRVCTRTERIHPLMRLLIKHRQGNAS